MSDETLRDALLKQIRSLLDGGEAHVPLAQVLSQMPFQKQGIVPAGLPYSAWQMLEHLRITQRDILDFSNAEQTTYVPLEWPKQYWPASAAPPDAAAWDQSVEQLNRDRAAFEALLTHRELVEAFPWGTGQNLLREAMLIVDHNSYHLGELVAVRRLLDEWPPKG